MGHESPPQADRPDSVNARPKLDRRSLFALGGLGAIGAATGKNGPEAGMPYPGLTVRIVKRWGVWCAVVPDFDYKWHPGYETAPVKYMPINEFLKAVDAAAETEA